MSMDATQISLITEKLNGMTIFKANNIANAAIAAKIFIKPTCIVQQLLDERIIQRVGPNTYKLHVKK